MDIDDVVKPIVGVSRSYYADIRPRRTRIFREVQMAIARIGGIKHIAFHYGQAKSSADSPTTP